MDPVLAAYLTFTAILVITPGATTAVVVRNTLAGGRIAGLAAAAGAALGNTSHATAAGLGLTVVLARWPLAMTTVRVAGALYLGWLGLASMYRVLRHADGGLPIDAARADGRPRALGLPMRQGLTVNLLNPAIATFYLVVVPSFLPQGAPPGYFAALAAFHVLFALTCHGIWAVALDKLRRLIRPPLARRSLEALTAVALLGLSLRVLLSA
jgi:threonine/homoserine/homoserine lactone efflux protein